MLELSDLLRWAGTLEGTADELRQCQTRLRTAGPEMHWVSSAAKHFRDQLGSHVDELGRGADELDEAAAALRRHHAAAIAATDALGDAAEDVLRAAVSAAGRGVAAVTEAMDGARRAFEDAARSVFEGADDAVETLGRGLRL